MEFSNEQAIMVTGSSGWLGRSLVQELRAMAPVVALYRHCLPEPQDRVYPVWCDLLNTELIPAALRGVQTVVHLAWDDEHNEQHTSLNLRATENLIKGMKDEGVKNLIFVSSLGVSRDATTAYLREKYEAECCALNSGLENVVIWRPAPLFGGPAVSDRFLRCLYNAARMPLFHPEVVSETLSPLHKDDFICMLSQNLQQTASANLSVFDAVGPDRYTVGELLCEVGAAMGKGMSLGIRGRAGLFLLKTLERKSGYIGRKLIDYAHMSTSHVGYEVKNGLLELKESLKALSFQGGLDEQKALAVDVVAQSTPQARLES
ncbi:MAG: NAD-dependent epimerase/dehydratase family protein [Oligoflexales bacterium]